VVLMAALSRDRVLARLFFHLPRDQPPDAGPHERDEEEAPDELGEGELPAKEDPKDDPDLEDEVRRRELEGHRGCEARSFLEEGLGDRHRGVAAGGGGRPEAGRQRELAGAAAAEGALEAVARDPGLDDPGEQEAEHESPPHLPGHLEGVPKTLADELQRIHRGDLRFNRSSSVGPSTRDERHRGL
jgi:hypothetical protein